MPCFNVSVGTVRLTLVELADVFGLYRRYRVLTSPHFLLVYPTVVPLEGFELASRRPS